MTVCLDWVLLSDQDRLGNFAVGAISSVLQNFDSQTIRGEALAWVSQSPMVPERRVVPFVTCIPKVFIEPKSDRTLALSNVERFVGPTQFTINAINDVFYMAFTLQTSMAGVTESATSRAWRGFQG